MGGLIWMSDLWGKFVFFDFWIYCCINCIYVFLVFNEIEKKYLD